MVLPGPWINEQKKETLRSERLLGCVMVGHAARSVGTCERGCDAGEHLHAGVCHARERTWGQDEHVQINTWQSADIGKQQSGHARGRRVGRETIGSGCTRTNEGYMAQECTLQTTTLRTDVGRTCKTHRTRRTVTVLASGGCWQRDMATA